MGFTKWFNLPYGDFGNYDDNEVRVRSSIRDPVKVRLSVDESQVESNLGGVSFNKTRSDNRDEEQALIMGRMNGGSGAIYMATRRQGDQPSQERFYIDHTRALFHVPIFAPNLPSQGVETSRFYSTYVNPVTGETTRLCFNPQADPDSYGDIVVYDTKNTTDESQWVAVGKHQMIRF